MFRNSAEVQYRAMAHASYVLMWIKHLITELKLNV